MFGRPPSDHDIYKIRVRRPKLGDSTTMYYSSRSLAYKTARKAEARGTLVFFGRFLLQEEIRFARPEK